MTRYVECPICENKKAREGVNCHFCQGMGLVAEHKMMRKLDKYDILLSFVRDLATTSFRDNDADYHHNLILINAENVLKRIGELK